MTLYFARYKKQNSPMQIDYGSHHYINVTQELLTHRILVNFENELLSVKYPHLDAFLSEWDELEYEVKNNELVSRLVGNI